MSKIKQAEQMARIETVKSAYEKLKTCADFNEAKTSIKCAMLAIELNISYPSARKYAEEAGIVL